MSTSRWITAACLALAAACSSSDGSAATVAGTWSEPTTIPGAALSFTLTLSGATVTGSGHYAIEAGAAGAVTVTGSWQDSTLQIHLVFEDGTTADFTGALQGSQHLAGTITYPGQNPTAIEFTKS